MGFFRRIEDFFERLPPNTVHFSEVEKELRRQEMVEGAGAVRWADVSRVVAWKAERLTVRVFWNGGDMVIGEGDPGWSEFIGRLNGALPVTPGWEGNVTSVETIVYQRV